MRGCAIGSSVEHGAEPASGTLRDMWLLYLGCVLVLTGVCAVIGWAVTPRNQLSWANALPIVLVVAVVMWSAVTTDLARLVLLAFLPAGWLAMTLASRMRLARMRTGARDESAQ